MGMEQDKSRKTIDNWALIIAVVLASAFGVTIFAKDWQYGFVFFGILAFGVISVKKRWFSNRIFHD
ncbi:MAG: hypothetical protein GTN97_05580 [Nitrosopumilaceae archaeon]|nr:hypothetical protein [Nitrosopumilaceae archaeon]NIP10173.1 hypothetical protein [Nitrosopumilaceae archaeon]NIS95371.1 hypothetical protein [Nitrosopumilaceae archaeon]